MHPKTNHGAKFEGYFRLILGLTGIKMGTMMNTTEKRQAKLHLCWKVAGARSHLVSVSVVWSGTRQLSGTRSKERHV